MCAQPARRTGRFERRTPAGLLDRPWSRCGGETAAPDGSIAELRPECLTALRFIMEHYADRRSPALTIINVWNAIPFDDDRAASCRERSGVCSTGQATRMPSQRIDSAGAKGPSPPLRRIWLHRATLLILATALGLGAGWLGLAGPWREPAPAHSPLPGVLWPNPRPIGAFTLQDHHGQAFTREHLDGAWTFMFFGYTHCPDICPTTLATLRRVEHDLAEHVSAPRQHVLVSVDPARDTVEHLAGYVSSFGPAFLGVTGNDGELSKLAREVGAVYLPRRAGRPDDSYLRRPHRVDHADRPARTSRVECRDARR